LARRGLPVSSTPQGNPPRNRSALEADGSASPVAELHERQLSARDHDAHRRLGFSQHAGHVCRGQKLVELCVGGTHS